MSIGIQVDMDAIERARVHALDGRYEEALATLGSLNLPQKSGLPALTLKGNILALKANDHKLHLSHSEVDNLRMSAQECYESVLKQDNEYVLAYIDLGDLWRDKGNHIAAIEFFNKALKLLNTGIFVESLRDELEEAHRGKISALIETKLQNELVHARAAAMKDLPDLEWA